MTLTSTAVYNNHADVSVVSQSKRRAPRSPMLLPLIFADVVSRACALVPVLLRRGIL